MDVYHTSVLLKEAIDYLEIKKGGRYIDATLGGGGHAGRIIEHGGIVLGIDADQDALEYVEEKFRVENSEFRIGTNLILAKGNFKDIDKIAKESGFSKASGIIFDLGVSSHQLDVAKRGFSFQRGGPLDMRMDQDLAVKAADLVNILTRDELTELFDKFGEERFAKVIAKAIVSSRIANPIQTTTELVEIIEGVVPRQRSEINPATKVFQALRMVINDETNSLREALPKAFDLLDAKGRLVVISFHSLEDRIVKRQFKEWDDQGIGHIITKKPVSPSDEELQVNRRARSSKLRVIEKI